ncbi:MAG: hypothetical protein HDT47_07215 [Ruminococcaceae bacterium]|nr:hypothetical protein [Oscillospiraceae bacterium]
MSLKKCTSVFLAAVLFLFSCGCDKSDGIGKTETDADGEAFVYEQSSGVTHIAASEDTLYTLSFDEEDFKTFISAFSLDGKKISSAVLSDFNAYDIKCMCADTNNVYAAARSSKGFSVYTLDTENGEMKPICELEGLDSIEKIGVYDEKLYWLGKRREEAKPIGPFFTTKEDTLITYHDGGEKMGCIDLRSGENSFSEIDFPVAFSVSGDGVTVYAFDGESSYYFSDYANSSEKTYTNKLESIDDFEFFGKNGVFAFLGNVGVDGTLPVSKADGESGVNIAAEGVYILEMCGSETGYIWLNTSDSLTSAEHRIKRYDLSTLAISNMPIRVISSQYFSNPPFLAGSEIQLNQLSGEGFALKVLSLDKSYDVVMISSDQGVANDIKKKGCFYPLNNVAGVSEYLDRCFPYIKEAVTDSGGNICMLPLEVEIPIIVYNEKNCSENGLVFSTELEPFIQMVQRASTVSEYYDCLRDWIVHTQLNGYLSENSSFDTEEFRSLALLLKEKCTENIFRGNFDLYSALMTAQYSRNDKYYMDIYENTLFTQVKYNKEQISLLNDENLRAASMPVSGNGKSVAFCTFISVNPYSDRLPEILTFIENLVSEMSERQNSCMLADKSTYSNTAYAQDIYNIYENGDICFQIPAEIYNEDFNKYCADEITLDKFISEADRKLSAYLNE